MSDTLRGPDGRIKRGFFSPEPEDSPEHSGRETKRQCRPTPFRTRPQVTLKTGRIAPTIIPKSKKSKNPRHETNPLMFLTLPAAASAQQSVGKSFATDNRSTILAANALAEHNHRHGNVAMPGQDSLRAWLDDNKREFARARLTRRAAKKRVQRLQDAPRPTLADANGAVPAAVHPAARPSTLNQPTRGMVRRARKYCRQMVESLVTRLNTFGRQIYTDLHVEEDRLLARNRRGRVPDAADGQVPDAAEGREIETQLEQVFEQALPTTNNTAPAPHSSFRSQLDEEFDTDSEDEVVERFSNPPPPVVDPSNPRPPASRHRRIEPVMPLLDPRFFHPDGRLHSVYKYLTAQIPLPRQWVDWAAQNGISYVLGRGPLNGPGTYIADDTFDYDALHRVIHSGVFRTGRWEIDEFAAYWPLAESERDHRVAHFNHLRRFPKRKPGPSATKAVPSQAPAEAAQPGPLINLGVNQEQRPGTFGLPGNFYDSSSSSDSGSDSGIRAAPAPVAPLVSRQGGGSTAGTRGSGEEGGRPVEKQHQTPLRERLAQLQGGYHHQHEEGSQQRQTRPHQRRDAQPLVNLQQQVVPNQQTRASGREPSLDLPPPTQQQKQKQVQQPQPTEVKAALDSESTERYRKQQQQPQPPKQPSKRKAAEEHQPQPSPQERQQKRSQPSPSFGLPGEIGLFMSGRPAPREPTSTSTITTTTTTTADVETRAHQPRQLTPPSQQTRPLPEPTVRTPENQKLRELNPPTWSGKRRVMEQLRREEEETRRRQAEQRREAEQQQQRQRERQRQRAEMRRLQKEAEEEEQQQQQRREEAAKAEQVRRLDEMITAQEDAELAADEAREWQRQRREHAAAVLRNARANLRTNITQTVTPARRKDVPSPAAGSKKQK